MFARIVRQTQGLALRFQHNPPFGNLRNAEICFNWFVIEARVQCRAEPAVLRERLESALSGLSLQSATTAGMRPIADLVDNRTPPRRPTSALPPPCFERSRDQSGRVGHPIPQVVTWFGRFLTTGAREQVRVLDR